MENTSTKQPFIRVLICHPSGATFVATIENSLETLQAMVGGLIEIVETNAIGIVAVCNEDWTGLDLNRRPSLGLFVRGTFVLCAEQHTADDIHFASLSDEWLCKYLPTPAGAL